MEIEGFLSRLEGVKKTPSGWDTRCPSHEDHKASLSVGVGDNGGIVLHCHAGCAPAAVVGAVGLKLSDLMPSDNGNGKPHSTIVATYDYRDAAGQLAFQVVRFHPKDFRQRRPDGSGGWTWSLKGVERVPYRLPELLAADPAATVFVCEGEKDCDRLAGLGLVATCNPGGAGKWKADYAKRLAGRRVVIVPDNDAAGRKHAEQVAANLSGAAASVKVVELPDVPDKGDVSDWLAAGGSAAELLQLADAAPEWEPDEQTTATSGHHHLTDIGNGERLAEQHGKNLRYCWPWSKWLKWTGRRWKLDDTGAVAKLAKETARSIYSEAAACIDENERKATAKWAACSEKRDRLSAMIDLARSEPGIPVLPEQLDRDPWLLNCKNGTLDLRTGNLRKHQREEYLSKLCPTPYDPAAECPTWEAFLQRIFGGDGELTGFVKRLAGYFVTGSVRDHILPIFWGSGSNGKSTLLGALLKVMGPDYSIKAAPDMLMIRRGEHHPTERADLFGKRLVAAVETQEGGRLNESLIKDLTGGDRQRARRMREDFWEFAPTHKLVLATNHKPTIKDTTHSTWRRVKLVPFQVVIPDEEQDHDLPAKLEAEARGILRWIVDGCLEWQQHGLPEPEAVKTATGEYRENQDALGPFLSECCLQHPGATVRAKDLYEVYKRHSTDAGEEPLSQRKFGEALTERGFDRFTSNGTWYRGIDLNTEWD